MSTFLEGPGCPSLAPPHSLLPPQHVLEGDEFIDP